jgi:gliding motility-associated-like protein
MKNIHLILFLLVLGFAPQWLSAQVPGIKLDTLSIPCTSTDTFSIPVRVVNFTNIVGVQFTTTWNPAHLEFQAISAVSAPFAGAVPAVDTSNSTTAQGRTTFVWSNVTSVTVPSGTVLYRIVFKRLGGGPTPVTIDLTPTAQTPASVINSNLDEFVPQVLAGRVVPLDASAPTITCPPTQNLTGNGPTPVPNIAPNPQDNCGVDQVGWVSAGDTQVAFPNDPDASGFFFNPGTSVVTYTAQDVGGNTATCSFSINLENTGPDTLTVVAGNAAPNCNNQFFVDISVLNFDSIGGLQFSVQWDSTLMDFQSVSNFNTDLNITLGNFSTLYTLSDGALSFFWNTDNLAAGNTLANGTVLFRINFANLGGANANSIVGFGTFPTPPEAVDPNANALPVNFATGSVVVTDNVLPTITCPASQSVPIDANGTATVTGLTPTFADNCAGPLALTYVRSAPTGGSGSGVADGIFQPGTTNVTYTVTDVEGNTATCSFAVVVDAGSLPGIKLDSVIHNCTDSTVVVNVRVFNFEDLVGLNFQVKWNPAVLQYLSFGNVFPGTGITAGSFPGINVLSPNGSLFFAETTANPAGWPNIPDGGILFSLTFKVLNLNGSTSIIFDEPSDAINSVPDIVPANFINGNFVSADLSGPVVTCPSNITAPATNLCQANVLVPSATATDACGTVASIVSNVPAGNLFPAGPTSVTFTATDAAGNTGTCSMTVTVNANTNISFTNCPQTPFVIASTDSTCSAPITYPLLTAQNPCVANANFSYNYNFPVGTVRPVGTTTVVATATQLGNGGGVVTCNFQVTIVDQSAPSIVCPANVTIDADPGQCYALNANVPVPTATDNCTSSANITLLTDQALLDSLPSGTSTIVYLAQDQAGNAAACSFQVQVKDGSAPTLTCPADITMATDPNGCTATVTWTAPTPTDNCTDSGSIDLNATAGPGSIFEAGVTVVEYTATDLSGNSATCSFQVSVLENIPPTITNCPNPVILVLPLDDCDTTITWTPPAISDNCGLDTVLVSHQPGTNFPAGTTIVTYTAIDLSGNETTCSFQVTANDLVDPVFLTFPPNQTVTSGPCGAILNITPPTASDNCDPNPMITYAGSLQDTFPVGVTSIDIKLEDASGNLVIQTLIITVLSPLPPSFANVPNNQNIIGCSGVATWTAPTPQGFCGSPVVTSNFNSGDTFPIDSTLVTYTATDTTGVGTIITASFWIIVSENTPPVITCPNAVLVSAAGAVISDPSGIVASVATDNCTGVTMTLNAPAATDNCPDALTVVQTAGPSAAGGTFPIGTHTMTYVARDQSQNEAPCSYLIEVQPFDALAPNATPGVGCEGGTVVIAAQAVPGATYTWSGPQGGLPNQPSITLTNFSAAQAGTYIVSASLNGCNTGSDTTIAYLATLPDALDDLTVSIGLGETLDSIDVLANDVFTLASDIILTQQSPLDGLTLGSDGLFTYEASPNRAGSVSFLYEICSRACPDLCDMATVTITIRDNECDFVPNIFTPNGDNSNDLLEIPCLDSGLYPNNEIVIYNQWGDKVFEAQGYDNTPAKAWMGTLNNEVGKELPDGVYYYIFRPDPNASVVKGFVHIFR